MKKPVTICTLGSGYLGAIDEENNLTCDDLPPEVIQAIEEQAGWGCQSSGKFERGGQQYSWQIVRTGI